MNDGMLERINEKISVLYSNDRSYYHTIYHVKTMRAMMKNYWSDFQAKSSGFIDVDSVQMKLETAILFHDCVYEPGSKMNEEYSADEADAFLRLEGADKEVRKDVTDLIMSTKLGAKLDTPEKMFLHDLDWSGFATYEQMLLDEKRVINEFRDAGYILREVHRGRFDFYKSLDKSKIFYSIFEKYEKIAHRNIERRIVEFNLSV